MLERDQANLADAFIQMIYYCYMPIPRVTKYFLYVANRIKTGKYSLITLAAGRIWKITPHSASCERVFSTLGWIYGKHRLHLQTSKVESIMARIWSFYVSKVNDELRYASSKYSERELKIMIDESLNDIEEDFENDEPERVLVEQHEIPNHIVSVLILEDIFDIKNVPFIIDPEEDDDDSESESKNKHENNVDNVNPTEENDNNDYDVDALAAKYLD
ncbi:unnamed protein product [Rhizophagus irregularis]|nr:unnamed protein product [Rhizophagus irregularis]